jgi:hypothetical protein
VATSSGFLQLAYASVERWELIPLWGRCRAVNHGFQRATSEQADAFLNSAFQVPQVGGDPSVMLRTSQRAMNPMLQTIRLLRRTCGSWRACDAQRQLRTMVLTGMTDVVPRGCLVVTSVLEEG